MALVVAADEVDLAVVHDRPRSAAPPAGGIAPPTVQLFAAGSKVHTFCTLDSFGYPPVNAPTTWIEPSSATRLEVMHLEGRGPEIRPGATDRVVLLGLLQTAATDQVSLPAHLDHRRLVARLGDAGVAGEGELPEARDGAVRCGPTPAIEGTPAAFTANSMYAPGGASWPLGGASTERDAPACVNGSARKR